MFAAAVMFLPGLMLATPVAESNHPAVTTVLMDGTADHHIRSSDTRPDHRAPIRLGEEVDASAEVDAGPDAAPSRPDAVAHLPPLDDDDGCGCAHSASNMSLLALVLLCSPLVFRRRIKWRNQHRHGV